MKLKPLIAIKEHCENFEMGTLDGGDSESFGTGHQNCEKMLYLFVFKAARLHLSGRSGCPRQYISICPDYLRLQNDIEAERLRQKGGGFFCTATI